MFKLPRILQRRAPHRPEGAEGLRSLFVKFRRILDMNTRVLERMAVMEQALGGDSIFDQAFLDSSVREITSHVHQVVYSLNALCDERYVDLYDRYVEIKNILGDILAGGHGPLASASALPASAIRWDMESLVGARAARLCELRGRLELPAPDGFAVTTTGCARLRAGGGERERAMLAVEREARALDERMPGAALRVEACLAGPEPERGQPRSVAVETDAEGLVAALDRALDELCAQSPRASQSLDAARPTAWVRRTVVAALRGRVRSMAREAVPGVGEALAVDAAPAGDSEALERFLLRRTYPFDLLRSEIRPKALAHKLPDGRTPMTPLSSGLWRGSALLAPEQLGHLAEAGLAAERLFGPPQALAFLVDERGEALFLDAAPMVASVHEAPQAEADDGERLAEALAAARVLARGGLAAQSGVAAGRVVHVDEDARAEDFPPGAIAVARRACPRLTRVLRRAAAMVTEVGTPAGHLATIAREARVPALFGLAGALRAIPQGAEVTVDTASGMVYEGIVEPLLDPAASGAELFPSDPEYVTLRRLLRFIQPLRLTDPQSPEFTPEHCRSFHDIIHFSHERAVEELLHIGKRHRGVGAVHTRRLDLDVAMDLRVLDLEAEARGDGALSGEMAPGDVDSEPFAAFVRGLGRKDMWSDQPVGLGLRDLMRGMGTAGAALSADPRSMSGNLAIVAPGYCNVSLRLGYHFSVLDAYLGTGPNQNSIYFRFVGGLADATRRARRAVLVARVLEALDFAVESQGDLVMGRLRLVDGPDAVRALVRLGELTAFTRQLDMAMTSDSAVDELTQWFLDAARDGDEPQGATAPSTEAP